MRHGRAIDFVVLKTPVISYCLAALVVYFAGLGVAQLICYAITGDWIQQQ